MNLRRMPSIIKLAAMTQVAFSEALHAHDGGDKHYSFAIALPSLLGANASSKWAPTNPPPSCMSGFGATVCKPDARYLRRDHGAPGDNRFRLEGVL